MKKIMLLIMAMLFAAVCLSAAAEEPQDTRLTCSMEEGVLAVRIALDANDPGTWEVRMYDEDENRSLVLKSAESDESAALFTFAPVADGWDEVDIMHLVNSVCDECYYFTAEVEDGAIAEEPYFSHIIRPKKAYLNPYLIGQWSEAETQSETMEITDGENDSWNITINFRTDAGASRLTTTALYDCNEDALAYIDGALYNLSADGEAETAAPAQENLTGYVFVDVTEEEDGRLLLVWKNPVTEQVEFFLMDGENVPDILVPEILDIELSEDDTMPDGVFWAGIAPEDLKTGVNMDVIFYSVDLYSGIDVRQISVGEMIYRDFGMYIVESVAEDGTVNYTEANTGIGRTMRLVNIPGIDVYVAVDVTGTQLPLMTAQNMIDMSLAEGAELLMVTGDLNAKSVDAAVLAEAIELDDVLYGPRTVVRVQNGLITEIRHYQDVAIPEMMGDFLSLAAEE